MRFLSVFSSCLVFLMGCSSENFNQFFYRKLKPEARPIESPDDPFRLVSAADCRLMVFKSVSEATRLWIKGRDFSIQKLLGDSYKADWARYDGGSVAIFRLAPQDYHRFHSAVDGKIGKMEYISGEYYTVNVCYLCLWLAVGVIDDLTPIASSHPNFVGRVRR